MTPPAERDDVAKYVRVLHNPTVTEKDRVDACHALGRAKTPAATGALVDSLRDDDFTVRWAAAEALAEHGRAAIEPLMHALIGRDDRFLREGAHHVLSRLHGAATHDLVKPVMEALEGRTPSVSVPKAANAVLAQLAAH
jgi:HEAT repeat protein